MILPKNDRKYKSVKRIRRYDSLESTIQLMCYKGCFHFRCSNKRNLCKSCWFHGLKPEE